MTARSVLLGRVVLWLAAFGALAVLDPPAPQTALGVGLWAPAVGALTGAALFTVLGRPRPRLFLSSSLRRGETAARSALLIGRSAYEEALWRGIALGFLSAELGPLLALATTTLAFAIAHVPGQGRWAAVHVLTGATFGAVFLATGSLVAAIAAHATYNVLVSLAVVASRKTCPVRTLAGAPAAAYHPPASAVEPDVAAMGEPALSPTFARPLASLRDVCKRYGTIEALKGVGFELRAGEVVALLGPNGAGKTTVVNVLLGLRRPDSGTVRLFGLDPRDPAARRRLGATPQELGFPTTLHVEEVVRLVGAHFEEPVATETLLERFDLRALARRQVGGLSGGQRRRLAVALAFAGSPRALVLDEPTTGLDVESRNRVWSAILAHAQDGGGVLLTTHQLNEAEALASRIVVIGAGQVVAEGTVDELKARAGLARVRVRAERLPPHPSVVELEERHGVLTAYTSDPDGLVDAIVRSGVSYSGLEVSRASLEEAFLALTRGER